MMKSSHSTRKFKLKARQGNTRVPSKTSTTTPTPRPEYVPPKKKRSK